MGDKEERGRQLLETTEMRMLRRIKGITLRDRQRSEEIRQELGVEDINVKVRQARLRWFGHLQRMDDRNPIKGTLNMEVSGTRPRGRPCTRWRDNIRNDMSFFEVREEDAMDRKVWKRKIQDPDPAT